MLLPRCIFCVIFSIILIAVDCAIFSPNNKYSSRQTLHSVSINNGVIEIARSSGRLRRNSETAGNGATTASTTTSAVHSSKTAHSSATGTTPKTVQSSAAAKSTTTAPSKLGKSTVIPGGNVEIEVHPFVLNGTQKANQAFIHWIGKGTSERIVILTCTQNTSDGSRSVVESQLWRSDNYGTSFKEIYLGPGAKISYFYTFAQNEKKLLFTDVSAKKIYITQDELDTHEALSVPVEPDVVLPHPTDENKTLLYSLNQRQLYVSTDFAKTWTILSENVLPNFYWGVQGVDSDVDTVHMEVEAGMPTQASYKVCSLPDCKNAIVDQVGPFMADSLAVHKEYIFVQKSTYLGTDSYMMVSYNRKPFKRAFFPGDLKTDDFMLLNLDDGQVFVAVNHGDMVNLYLSEVTGQYYVLSFTNVYHILRLGYFEIDFHEVQSMNWTFLANKRETNGVKTYISFDKGGNWKPLTLNKSCTVEEKCSLLLEVKQSALTTSMMSQESAPGIIVAHGIVGINFRDTNLFTSSDGGATWLKAVTSDGTPLVGRYRLNFLDQGGILTAVPDGLLTGYSNKTVFYSYDEGKQWQKQDFDSAGLIVKGVLTEPGSRTMVASVFGHEGVYKPWTVIKMNFSRTLPVKCGQNDYENWYPRDYNNLNNNTCILGQVVVYTRRSPGVKCYNGEAAITRIVQNTTCECTSEDYECDFGYEEKGDGCQKAAWFDEAYTPPECDSGGTYNKSQGYRKIPADLCVESKSDQKQKKYIKVETPCHSAAPSKLSIIVQSSKLPAGKEVTFHLEQAGGSKFDSKYTWNFGDSNQPEVESGFQNASIKKHTFKFAKHYTVNVTVENKKGKAVASAEIHVQDPLVSMFMLAPLAGKIGVPVTFNVIPTSASRVIDTSSDHLHFVWNFGDGSDGQLPVLTWNSSVTHVFNKAGTYRMSVEAVNSVSSIYKEQFIHIFDDAEILLLTFSSNVDRYSISAVLAELFTLRIKQQLAEDLGVSTERLEAVIVSTTPTTAHLFIFPSTDPKEASVAAIRDKVISQVQKGVLGVNLFGKNYEAGEIISIVSAKKLSEAGQSSGPNMKAVYIAAPVLVLVVIVSFVSFLYCRKKLQNLHQYNILHTHDDSDALLDDDEAPLDLNVDFATRASSRDDSMLDVGGSHLVLVTGGGSSDNAENC